MIRSERQAFIGGHVKPDVKTALVAEGKKNSRSASMEMSVILEGIMKERGYVIRDVIPKAVKSKRKMAVR